MPCAISRSTHRTHGAGEFFWNVITFVPMAADLQAMPSVANRPANRPTHWYRRDLSGKAAWVLSWTLAHMRGIFSTFDLECSYCWFQEDHYTMYFVHRKGNLMRCHLPPPPPAIKAYQEAQELPWQPLVFPRPGALQWPRSRTEGSWGEGSWFA